MGDFNFGYRPPQIRLLDQQLTLDPDIVRMMGEIEAQMAARRMIQEMLQPNWSLLLPHWESILNTPSSDIFRTPPPAPTSIWTSPRGAGPATPRPGELSDVTRALYQLPIVQRLTTQAHDEGMRQLRLLRTEWDTASTGERVAMVSMATVFAGSLITPIIANQQTRDLAFGLIKDKDIPVPGVDGLSFRLMDRGAGVTTPLGVPGLSGSAQMQFPNSSSPNYEFKINFDVMEFVRSRSRSR
jgi:hypothetical protein